MAETRVFPRRKIVRGREEKRPFFFNTLLYSSLGPWKLMIDGRKEREKKIEAWTEKSESYFNHRPQPTSPTPLQHTLHAQKEEKNRPLDLFLAPICFCLNICLKTDSHFWWRRKKWRKVAWQRSHTVSLICQPPLCTPFIGRTKRKGKEVEGCKLFSYSQQTLSCFLPALAYGKFFPFLLLLLLLPDGGLSWKLTHIAVCLDSFFGGWLGQKSGGWKKAKKEVWGETPFHM